MVTLGAGLRTLGILLRIQSMSGTGDRGDNLLHSFNPLMTRGLVLMALLGLAFHAAGIVWISWTMLAVFGVQAGVNNLLYALLNFEETSPAEQWWRGVLSKSSSDTDWLDLYASHDPVSNGAIWDEGAVTNATTLEIRNGGSFASDHTAYWRNKADFLSRVAGFLSRTGKLDVRLHQLVDGDNERIERECAQRRWRHGFVRCCWLLIAAAIAWVAVAHQDSIAVRCVGEQVRGQLNWLHGVSEKTVAWGVLAALLLLWTFACRWLRDVWDDAAAASLAGHKSFAVDLNVGLAWVLVVATLLFYFMLASQFGLPMA
ncbi:MAG: hypothetical protein JST65_06340 [Acidobacteria bacterium]|nr:hypothetical protein [Acidobacteriota bacterium]